MYYFDARKTKEDIVKWIVDWFENNGKGCKAVIGISGGKDSSVASPLCVEALGADRVIGVLMPQNRQDDIQDSRDLINHLKIESYEINIGSTVDGLLDIIKNSVGIAVSEQTEINLPARIRMSTLYAVSQSVNGRVVNTCNLSEDWIGYSTRYGDSVGDFSPLSNLTASEIKAIGKELKLPEHLIEKAPSDGLCGKTDEDRFGFTYEVLDKYIRTDVCEYLPLKEKIDSLHEKNMFKLQLMPAFNPNLSKKRIT